MSFVHNQSSCLAIHSGQSQLSRKSASSFFELALAKSAGVSSLFVLHFIGAWPIDNKALAHSKWPFHDASWRGDQLKDVTWATITSKPYFCQWVE